MGYYYKRSVKKRGKLKVGLKRIFDGSGSWRYIESGVDHGIDKNLGWN